MTEREFVLNYFCMQLDAEKSVSNIMRLKEFYKEICKNTPDKKTEKINAIINKVVIKVSSVETQIELLKMLEDLKNEE